jgi:hypothetical protein
MKDFEKVGKWDVARIEGVSKRWTRWGSGWDNNRHANRTD